MADRIVMCHEMGKAIEEVGDKIENKLFVKYVLKKYALLFMIREILEKDNRGLQLLRSPQAFVRNQYDRKYLGQLIRQLLNDVIIDVNAELKELGVDFDYRDRLRDEKWIKDLSGKVVGAYLKLVNRGRLPSFADEWNKMKP